MAQFLGGGGGADPKGLEGRPQGEEEGEGDGRIKPREFFWDSITLYVVYSIIGLTAIDVVTEFIRGTGVQCFSRGNQSLGDLDLQDYVNDFCSSALPNTEFFPTFTIVHGILIAIPHYLWLNHFGGSFDFFFQLASSLERLRDEKSGQYPDKNFVIAEQLEGAFSTYKQNSIYRLYFVKLLLQWVFTAAGFVVAIVYFTNFDANFVCPQTAEEALNNGAWPLTGERVMCVFTSLRLLELIRVADLILLALAILCLMWSLIWCTSTHSSELGHKSVAIFVFQSGLASRYFVPKFPVPRCLKLVRKYIHKLFTSIPWLAFHGPRIKTDLDFMMMKLFRTDGGLGHVLREVQILKEVKSLNDDERRRYNLHRREQSKRHLWTGALIEKEVAMADLKYIFEKGSGRGVYNDYQYLKLDTELVLPDSIRGAVLGFASRSPKNEGAICVSFGSPSMGFTDALGRIFSQVGFVNFNPYYRNPEELVKASLDSFGIVSLTSSDDILSEDVARDMFFKAANEIWKPGVTAGTFIDGDYVLKTNFLLISPIDKAFHKSTVNLLIELLIQRKHIADDAVLLTLYPLEIAGKDVHSEFHEYIPPESYFTREKRQCARVDRTLDKIVWLTKSSAAEYQQPLDVSPQADSSSSKAALIELKPTSSESAAESECRSEASSFDLSVLVGDAHSLFRFTMFTRVPPEPKAGKKAKKKVESSEKKESFKGHEDVGVKTKLLPKVPNEPQNSTPENLSVTIEHDSNV